MSIILLAAKVCKSQAIVGGADGTFHCLITEACSSSCSETFTPNYAAVIDPKQSSRQKRNAGSAVLCRRHDTLCYI